MLNNKSDAIIKKVRSIYKHMPILGSVVKENPVVKYCENFEVGEIVFEDYYTKCKLRVLPTEILFVPHNDGKMKILEFESYDDLLKGDIKRVY